MLRRVLAAALTLALLTPAPEAAVQAAEALPTPAGEPVLPAALPESAPDIATAFEPGSAGLGGPRSISDASLLPPPFPSFADGDTAEAVSPTDTRGREVEIDLGAGERTLRRIERSFGRVWAPTIQADEREGLAAAPAPQRGAPRKNGRTARRGYLLSIVGYKLGIDTVAVALPVAALQATGSATMVAMLMVASGLAQAAGGGLAGGLLRKSPPSRVLSRALAVQGMAAGALLAGHAFLGFHAWLALPLYTVFGLGQGLVETTRRCIPTVLVGTDSKELEAFNAKVHMAYEATGVAAGLLAGAALATQGPRLAVGGAAAVFAAASWLFRRLPSEEKAAFAAQELPRVRPAQWLRDLREGARVLWRKPSFRLALPGIVIPITVHRLLESMFYPVFSKTVLGHPAAAAWLLSASNAGELAGALALLKLASLRAGGPFRWLPRVAVATLGIGFFALGSPLPVLLGAAALHSVAWAASDLTLTSMLQAELPEKRQAQALGFVFSLHLALATALSLAFGAVFDRFGAGAGVWTFLAAAAAPSLALAWAARPSQAAGRNGP